MSEAPIAESTETVLEDELVTPHEPLLTSALELQLSVAVSTKVLRIFETGEVTLKAVVADGVRVLTVICTLPTFVQLRV